MSWHSFHVWGECSSDHARKNVGDPRGSWLRGNNNVLGVMIAKNGSRKYQFRCNECEERSTDIPYWQVEEWGIHEPGWVIIREPATYPACSVQDCPEPGCDRHHFAPRNTFGNEADMWPVMPLCLNHHREWHRRMNGYRWNAKGPDARDPET